MQAEVEGGVGAVSRRAGGMTMVVGRCVVVVEMES